MGREILVSFRKEKEQAPNDFMHSPNTSKQLRGGHLSMAFLREVQRRRSAAPGVVLGFAVVKWVYECCFKSALPAGCKRGRGGQMKKAMAASGRVAVQHCRTSLSADVASKLPL